MSEENKSKLEMIGNLGVAYEKTDGGIRINAESQMGFMDEEQEYLDMKNDKRIRTYLKSLTDADISDSTFFIGIDFNTASMDDILDSIIALSENVCDLKKIVDSDFKGTSEDKVLLPKSSTTQSIVIENYERKRNVLYKVLALQVIKDAIIEKIDKRKIEEIKANVLRKDRHNFF